MSSCSRCGQKIEFRYIDGICVPLHVEGGCIDDIDGKVDDFSGYRVSKESCCFSTSCPECNSDVYFIRHNGGSVWIDPPLGPPWIKHECFDNQVDSSVSSVTIDCNLEQISQIKDHELSSSLLIGVVVATKVDKNKRFTDIEFFTSKAEALRLRLKFNAGFLCGRLSIYNRKLKEIFPVEDPDKKFKECRPGEEKSIPSQLVTRKPIKRPKLVECPRCSKKVYSNRKKNHMKYCNG